MVMVLDYDSNITELIETCPDDIKEDKREEYIDEIIKLAIY